MSTIPRKSLLPLALVLCLTIAGCDLFKGGDDGGDGEEATTFTVTVENVSTPGTIDTDRAMGTVPLSPGAWATFTGDDPAFTVGEAADSGTRLIAEDGFASMAMSPPGTEGTEAELLEAASNTVQVGTFASPGGTPDVPALFAGESAEFTFTAMPGQRLQLETMFVQSNDWFYAFGDGGLHLFDDDGAPVSGDVTDYLVVYDAGTEADTAPGTGPDQKPAQDPTAINQGPDDSVNMVESASSRHSDFTIPANDQVIRVTITPQM